MKEFWNKYKLRIGVVLAVVLLFFAGKCAHDKQVSLEGQNKILTEQLNTLKDSIVKTENERIAEKDSLKKDNDSKQQKIDSLEQRDSVSKSKIADLKKQLSKKIEQIDNYTPSEVAEAINKRYNTTTTTATDSTVTATVVTGKKIVVELAEKDTCEETSKIQEGQLADKDQVIEETRGQLENTKTQLDSAEKSINMFKDYAEKSDKIRLDDESIINNLKTQNTIRWILLPASFVAGFLLAK